MSLPRSGGLSVAVFLHYAPVAPTSPVVVDLSEVAFPSPQSLIELFQHYPWQDSWGVWRGSLPLGGLAESPVN